MYFLKSGLLFSLYNFPMIIECLNLSQNTDWLMFNNCEKVSIIMLFIV